MDAKKTTVIAAEASSTLDIGISYLRVSSKRQMDTDADVDPDGNSINTQREWCGDKAKAMRVMVQKEFIEPGTSAQSIAKRKVFKELLAYLKVHPEVKYVFIYMRSRAFRNFTDAAITKRQLLEMGVKLVSAKEDFGEGIMADAMEAVTDIMNEVQVRLSGQDIATKMANKAKHGGTNGLAKTGYLNAKVLVDGRKVNSVIVDPERKPLIVRSFELMAAGTYTAEQVHSMMADAGLTSPGRLNPIGKQTFYNLLRERYYTGKLTYKGIQYQGRHEPLISEELFDRVQRVLDSHAGSGTRQRNHHHYLKGVVWCARCKNRLIIMPGKGNGGLYFYFLCRGRQQHQCDHPYVPVDVMVKAVVQHYQRASFLPEGFREAVRTAMDEAASEHHELSSELRDSFTRQLEKLDKKENYFLDLAAEEGWPKDKLKAKLDAIRTEQASIRRQLDQADNRLDTGRQLVLKALALMERPGDMYAVGRERVRTILNRTFFTRLYIDGDKVTGQELAEPFDALHEAYLIAQAATVERTADDVQTTPGNKVYYRRNGAVGITDEPNTDRADAGWLKSLQLYEGQTANSADLLVETDAASRNTLIRLLGLSLAGQGSSKGVMVEVPGIEPGSSVASSGLLRAQFTMPLLDPTDHVN